jgi:hypothetical protein
VGLKRAIIPPSEGRRKYRKKGVEFDERFGMVLYNLLYLISQI